MTTLPVYLRALLATGLMAGAAWAAEPAGKTYTVQAGDTMDKVIRQHLADSPLKTEVLRQALMQQNPQAFTQSTPRVLIAGAVLRLPSNEDLLRTQLGASGKSSASAPAGNTWAGGYSTRDMNMNERKNWVRFP
ncbi:LysM domain [Burkholderiaceae bacterium]